MLVSPALRRLVASWPGRQEEQERLAREERLRDSLLVRGQRLLVPMGIAPRPELAAALLDAAWPPEAELTVLSVPGGDGAVPPSGLSRPVRRRTAANHDPLAAVLAEANFGYGVIGLGLAEATMARELRGEAASGSTVAVLPGLLNASPVPVLMVRPASPRGAPAASPSPRRIAIAVTGTATSLAAEELAFNLALREQAALHIVHVLPATRAGDDGETGGESAADRVLDAARRRAADMGLEPTLARRRDRSVATGLSDYARRHAIDLLIVGTRLRRVADAPFLGHSVEGLLQELTFTDLAIVALPEAPQLEDQPYAARRHA
jgi:nucleotide-binding universal stress UspA family protein